MASHRHPQKLPCVAKSEHDHSRAQACAVRRHRPGLHGATRSGRAQGEGLPASGAFAASERHIRQVLNQPGTTWLPI